MTKEEIKAMAFGFVAVLVLGLALIAIVTAR